MRLLLIVNSSASSVTPRTRVLVTKALSTDHAVTVAETSRRGHATRLAQDAAAKGFDAVAALGGDGTLNETANGLAGSPCALVALPGGSTNVFARTIGLPNDPVEATEVVRRALAVGSQRRVGLGAVNGRYFLFHTGIGFDAEVVHQVERRGTMKRYLGHPLFLYATVATWLRHYDRRRPQFTVRHADDPTAVEGSFSICLNTNPYTYLGNRAVDLTPAASLDRGLVMVTFSSLAISPLLQAVGGALRSRLQPDRVERPRRAHRPGTRGGHWSRTVPVPGRRGLPGPHRTAAVHPPSGRVDPGGAPAVRRAESGRRSFLPCDVQENKSLPRWGFLGMFALVPRCPFSASRGLGTACEPFHTPLRSPSEDLRVCLFGPGPRPGCRRLA